MRAGFIFGEAFTGIRRNITMTIAMVLTTAISLLLLGLGLVLTRVADNTQEMYGDRTQMRVNLTAELSVGDPDCRADVCQGLLEQLRAMPEVESVDFQSQEQAWQDFQRLFANNPEVLKVGRKEALSAFFRVKPVEPQDAAAISAMMTGAPGVASAVDQTQDILKIMSFFDRIRVAAIALAIAAGIAAILLIANMVQVAALSRKAETTIMRLVGASRWRTQLPFMIEAVVASIFGVALAIGGLVLAKTYLLDEVLGSLISSNVLAAAQFSDIAFAAYWIAPIGVALAAVTAYLTLRFYVRK